MSGAPPIGSAWKTAGTPDRSTMSHGNEQRRTRRQAHRPRLGSNGFSTLEPSSGSPPDWE